MTWLKKYIDAFPQNEYILFSKKKGPDEEYFNVKGIRSYSFSLKYLDFILSPFFSLYFCVVNKPDIVYLNTSIHGLDAFILRLFRYNVITIMHEDINLYKDNYKLYLIKLSIYFSSKIICISKFVYKKLIEHCSSDKILLVENYLDEISIINKSHDIISDDEFYNFYSDNSDNIFLCSVGLFNENKNIIKILDMLENLNKKFSLILIGDFVSSKLEMEFYEKLKNKKLADRVYITGLVENPYAYMRKMNVCLIFSNYETFSYVLYESLLLNLSVIANKIEAFPDDLEKYNVTYIDILDENIDFSSKISEALEKKDNSISFENIHTVEKFRKSINNSLKLK